MAAGPVHQEQPARTRAALGAGASRSRHSDGSLPLGDGLEISDQDRVRAPALATEDELLRFLAADFADGTASSAVPPAEAVGLMREADDWCITHGGGSKRVVHIESAATGAFHRALEPAAQARQDGGGGHALRRRSMLSIGGGGGAPARPRESAALAAELGITLGELAVLRGDLLLAAIWTLCQGVLAGAAMLPVFLAHVTSGGSDTRAGFLELYSGAANETRRFLFVLSTLALTGALDVCAQEERAARSWRALPRARRRALEASVALYAVCLVTSLVCAATDAVVTRAGAEGGADWAAAALQDPAFADKVDTWLAASAVRAAAALLAWLLACRRAYSVALESIRSKHAIATQHEAAAMAHVALEHCRGHGLEELSDAHLGHLVAELRHGLDQAQATLALRCA